MYKLDVIIVGAGMAGLSAALELKSQGLSCLILEAQPHVGGRAASIVTSSGASADLGAHWLHGKDNPIRDLLDRYQIPYEKDKARHMRIYQDGKMHEAKGGAWLEECIDQAKAKSVKAKEIPDCKLSDLAVNKKSRKILQDFALMWNGLEPPTEPSALEFLTDLSTPGGLQIPQGIGVLFGHMLEEVGMRHILPNLPVVKITNDEEGVEVEAQDGSIFHAPKLLFTVSLTVLKSGMISFVPPLSDGLMRDLSRFAMGKMNKIIVELRPDFFEKRNIPDNLSLQLLDGKQPHFCHVHGAESPFMMLFISGDMAETVERMSSEQALAYMKTALLPVKDLTGFEGYMVGPPIVTGWVGNPYTQGAYSACLPGGKRSWPRQEGNVYLCGDTFDPYYFSSLAGAFRSGRAAAQLVAKELKS